MVRANFLGDHRPWEDMVGIGLGVLIVLAPWFAGASVNEAVATNTGLVAASVVAIAEVALVDLRRWEEGAEFVCGLWLIASPFVFDYAGADVLTIYHFILGALVALLAAFEFWQDWELSAEELAKHGQ